MCQITEKQVLGQTDNHISWLSENIGIHTDVVAPYTAMALAAKKDGIDITIASGFRSFERQLMIINKKLNGNTVIKDINNHIVNTSALTEQEILFAILLYSALPGASRHHWGTDIDVYSANGLVDGQKLQLEAWEYQKEGPFYKLHQWLNKHAETFGFYFPYDEYRQGVAPEPWHLSYKPLADIYHNKLTINLLHTALENTNIKNKSLIIDELPYILKTYIKNINRVISHG